MRNLLLTALIFFSVSASAVEKVLVKNVAANSNEQVDFVVPTGETWAIGRITTFGLHDRFEARVIWNVDDAANQEYLVNSSTVFQLERKISVVGDGVKKLRLFIKNSDLSLSRVVGLVVEYDKL